MTDPRRTFLTAATIAGLLVAPALAQDLPAPGQVCDLETDTVNSCSGKVEQWVRSRSEELFESKKAEAEEETVEALNKKLSRLTSKWRWFGVQLWTTWTSGSSRSFL